ncbi:3'-5' exonuclease [Marinicella gelatinilytica]|uniref:3'-5' exonuclease n=1 Tax=Marinicella gelatinilytica TaxID=2996017 RepID=UPI002260A3EF|nr:ATP-dependent helicase [Marinicella gelatinilytica]MCX7545353.1 ATP-dependent helicase [Marinicella gelatinilytica]
MLKKIELKGEQKKVLFLPSENPIQIKGVAGSGKTTVALYRAMHLYETAKNLFKDTNIAVFTYNKTLSAYIEALLPEIQSETQKLRNDFKIEVTNFHKWAYHFIGLKFNQTLNEGTQNKYINDILADLKSKESTILNKSSEFFLDEISWIKGKLFSGYSEYFEASRTGRGTADRVTKNDKKVIWTVFENYQNKLRNLNQVDFDDYAILALKKIESDPDFKPPFTHIVIDEAQDLNKAQIIVISKLVDSFTNSLSIIADAAQQIYKSGFVWSEVGINVKGGRTIEFKKNYRNSIHIAKAALSLLEKEPDKSQFTVAASVFKEGDKPKIANYSSVDEEYSCLVDQLNELKKNNRIKGTVVLHRTTFGVRKVYDYLIDYGFDVELVKTSSPVNYNSESVKICTMSSIKGLEFNNVFIIDLNDNLIPSPQGFLEENDEHHISTERRLLYTCMTRALDQLYLFSSDNNPSRYLNEIDPDLLLNIGPVKSAISLDDLPFLR